jgi:peptidoglycan/LPS O-acetylase OafA/YrhL
MLVGGLAFTELECGTSNFVRRLAFLGDSSYSLYLLHVIVLGGLFDASSLLFSVDEPARLILCVTFSAFCVVVSVICYNGIEVKIVQIRLRKKHAAVGK